MRKAQIQQVFIYLVAIFVIGFLIIFGYRMINNILDKKCDVDQASLVSGIQQQLDDNSRFGRVSQAKITAGCGYNELCFVDAAYEGTFIPGDAYATDERYALIRANAAENIPYNIYLLNPNNELLPIGYDERIDTEQKEGQHIFCVGAEQGSFTFWLEGLGKNGVAVYGG